MGRVVLGNGHAPKLGMLDDIVPRYKMNHLRIQPAGQLHDQLIFTVRIAAVAD
ncbi:hypothetical protein D3C76_1820860 [compost metagenome]